MSRKTKIEKAYNVVLEYSRKIKYDPVTEETHFQRKVALVKVAVDGDKVYLQSDPIDCGDGGDLIIKRVAEFNMSDAVTVLFEHFDSKKK